MPTRPKLFRRPLLKPLLARLRESRRFLQVLAGPRQAGKTTLARQALEALHAPSHYASADEPSLRDRPWIEEHWELGRLKCREAGKLGAFLVLDEVQKVTGWSETVKRLWDEDRVRSVPLKRLLAGLAEDCPRAFDAHGSRLCKIRK